MPGGSRLSKIWLEPGGAPSVGFHLRHIAGSIDRLLTYTAGHDLTDDQFESLARERVPGTPPAEVKDLITAAQSQVDRAIDIIRATPDESLFEPRSVGRSRLPTNVFGLLFHLAEHTQRHTGQLIATATIVRGLNVVDEPCSRSV
jgi:hypothetical protein